MKPISVLLQYTLPHHLVSRIVGFFISIKQPLIKNAIIKWFIQRYNVDMSEAKQHDINQFKTFNDFFTRELKPEVRVIAKAADEIVSPADGVISECGKIKENQLLQAKGMGYSLEALLANEDLSLPFKDGEFLTIYLSPKDYHCVHMPFTGSLEKMIYVPGRIFSVNPLTTNHVTNLFARNERVVCVFNTEFGKMAVIMVGAMIVAGISTSWQGQVTPPCHRKIIRWDYSNVALSKGEKLGHFSLGSTVIVLFEKNAAKLHGVNPNKKIQMGEKIANLISLR